MRIPCPGRSPCLPGPARPRLEWRAVISGSGALGALVFALGALALPGAAVGAQDALLQGRMEVGLPSPGTPIPVAMEYRLLPDSGSREVGLTLLAPGNTRLLAARASWAGGSLPLKLLERRPHYWSGSVTLPSGGGFGPGDPVSVGLTYEVDGGWEESGRASVPVLAVSWVPRDPHPRTFVARVEVPAGVTVVESFPTSVMERPRGAEGGTYEMALQGVPAFLVLRTVQGEAPFVTLEGILDAMVVLTLLIMAGFGVRYLRGVRR